VPVPNLNDAFDNDPDECAISVALITLCDESATGGDTDTWSVGAPRLPSVGRDPGVRLQNVGSARPRVER
jgi:hypothetical protein